MSELGPMVGVNLQTVCIFKLTCRTQAARLLTREPQEISFKDRTQRT